MRLHSEGHKGVSATLNDTTYLFDAAGNTVAHVNPDSVANFLLAFPGAYWLVDDQGQSLQAGAEALAADDEGATGEPAAIAEAETDDTAPPVVKRKPGRPRKAAVAGDTPTDAPTETPAE